MPQPSLTVPVLTVPDSVTTTMQVSLTPSACLQIFNAQAEAVEPIPNAFEPDSPPEEKTKAIVGPQEMVNMLESTEAGPMSPEDAPQDTRAPVGLDAGAPQVTDAAQDEGGWHGGAEEDPNSVEPAAATAPAGAPRVDVPEMDLDAEAKALADEALAAMEADTLD